MAQRRRHPQTCTRSLGDGIHCVCLASSVPPCGQQTWPEFVPSSLRVDQKRCFLSPRSLGEQGTVELKQDVTHPSSVWWMTPETSSARGPRSTPRCSKSPSSCGGWRGTTRCLKTTAGWGAQRDPQARARRSARLLVPQAGHTGSVEGVETSQSTQQTRARPTRERGRTRPPRNLDQHELLTLRGVLDPEFGGRCVAGLPHRAL